MASSGDDNDKNSDKNSASSSGNDWWGSFIKTAKEKSFNALEIIKTDLAEFKSTMTADTGKMINQATNQLKETTNQSFFNSPLFSTTETDAENATGSGKNNSGDNSKANITSKKKLKSINNSTIHDRYKQEIQALKANDQTYLTDPVNNVTVYLEQWSVSFNPDDYQSRIPDLLIENDEMRLLYSQLVPAQISNNQFWSRFFFKVSQLEEDYKIRVKVLERAIGPKDNNEDETWEDADDANDDTLTSKSENEADRGEKDVIETSEGKDSKIILPVPTEPVSPTSVLSKEDISANVPEPIQKSEDSDEWEKVSDSNENNETIKKKDSDSNVKTIPNTNVNINQINEKKSSDASEWGWDED